MVVVIAFQVPAMTVYTVDLALSGLFLEAYLATHCDTQYDIFTQQLIVNGSGSGLCKEGDPVTKKL